MPVIRTYNPKYIASYFQGRQRLVLSCYFNVKMSCLLYQPQVDTLSSHYHQDDRFNNLDTVKQEKAIVPR